MTSDRIIRAIAIATASKERILMDNTKLIARAHEAEARAEAHRRYNGDTVIDETTGEPTSHDDWGYAECQRAAFIAGAEWRSEAAT